ncbi:MAG: hypothetical protein OXN97_13430 [Bryobacterales bacterium]|nr:hypothetical protein [Bryobacterales bacterium]MDE0629470.1 hypothetical protein [Bryobacterales bacterium]
MGCAGSTRGATGSTQKGGFRPGGDVDYTSELRGSQLDVGFDRFFGISVSLDMSPYCFLRNRSVEALREIPAPSARADIFSGPAAGLRSQDLQVEEAARIIDLHAGRDRPLYLYLALASPHFPIAPVGGAMGRVGRNGDFVFETDRALGQVLEAPDQTVHAQRSEIVAELQDLLRATLKWHGRAQQPKLRPPRACRWTPHAGP